MESSIVVPDDPEKASNHSIDLNELTEVCQTLASENFIRGIKLAQITFL